MDTYAITVTLNGDSLDEDNVSVALAALKYPAILGKSGALTSVYADVTAATADDALNRLIDDLSCLSVQIIRIDPELVSISEIAERIEVSRESVRLWTVNKRRDGFPLPYTSAGGSLLWTWSDVFSWANAHSLISVIENLPLPSSVIAVANGQLAQRQLVTN